MKTYLVFFVLANIPYATYPDFAKPLVSPNGRGAVECHLKLDAEPDKAHRLLLKDLRSGRSTELRSFDRWVRVFWSPKGDRLALTDGEGSNISSSFVYTPGASTSLKDVFDLFEEQVPASRRVFLKGMDHVYLEIIRWIDNDHLQIKLWGHGDRQSFDQQFTIFVASAGRRSGRAAEHAA